MLIDLHWSKPSNYINFNKFSEMKNSQTSRSVSPDVMYKYHTHVNIPWNIPEYLPVRAYLDPNRQKTQRKYLERPKGKPDNKYKTKKGFYMDDHLKIMKPLPPPSHYNLKDPFDQADNLKRGKSNKVNQSLIKYSYLEWIQMEQKNRKKPAPGDYNLNKTDEQINEQLRELKNKRVNSGEKLFFYQQNEHLSNSVPGMGAYNPHLSVPHFRPDKRDHKFWIDKHKKMSQTFHKKRLSQPAPGSYSPLPMDMTTFDGIKTADLINKRRKSAKATGFGTDAKFPYQRKSKSVIKMEKPAPSAYNTAIEWKGKNMKLDKNNWVRSVSTGFTKSIYNS